MAISLNGNYIRINKEALKQKLESVQYHIYKDQSTRLEPSEFDMIREEVQAVSFSPEEIDAIVTSLYSKLKATEKFGESVDI